MYKMFVSVVVCATMLLSNACYAMPRRPVKPGELISQTGYIRFTPKLQIAGINIDVELPPQVIGSAWAVKDGRDYKVITAQHVGLATAGMPGLLEVCSYEMECQELDVLAGAGPIAGTAVYQDWIYWELDELPDGFRPSRVAGPPEVGQRVCAVGSPLGRINEVTCGAVTNHYEPMFYMDARVLPGNSGGPVFDDRGRVLGMVIAMDYPVAQGMSPVSNSALALEVDGIWF